MPSARSSLGNPGTDAPLNRSAPRPSPRTRPSAGTARQRARGSNPPRHAEGLADEPVKTPSPEALPSGEVDTVDTTYLQTLIGYNARRTALSIIELFLQRMAPYGLKPVDFSVMSVIHHNPGVTSRQLCNALNLLPPNLVGLVQNLQSRGLIEKKPHPRDGRAFGLHATPQGVELITAAEATAVALESDRAHRLSPQERQTLLTLLQKIYL